MKNNEYLDLLSKQEEDLNEIPMEHEIFTWEKDKFLVLKDPSEVAEKLKNVGNIPNFSPITSQDKGKVNQARMNLFFLLNCK